MQDTFRALLILLFSIISGVVFSQENETIVASVRYNFVHVYDRSRPDTPFKQEMILRLGKSSSKYTNFSQEVRMQAASQAPPPSAQTITVVGKPMAVVRNPVLPDREIFQYLTDGKLVLINSVGRSDYKIDQSLPAIAWKIESEKRKIGGYDCQKALGEFAGRKYIAWFTTELPFRNGPWKLSGLPGLILEAKDETNEVQFLFEEITKNEQSETIKSSASRPVPVSVEAFTKLKKAFELDPVTAIQSQLPPNSPAPILGYMDASGKVLTGERAQAMRSAGSSVKFNAIELH